MLPFELNEENLISKNLLFIGKTGCGKVPLISKTKQILDKAFVHEFTTDNTLQMKLYSEGFFNNLFFNIRFRKNVTLIFSEQSIKNSIPSAHRNNMSLLFLFHQDDAELKEIWKRYCTKTIESYENFVRLFDRYARPGQGCIVLNMVATGLLQTQMFYIPAVTSSM